MKSIRPLSALLVCAVLSGHAAGALAATTLTLTAPTDAVPSGSRSFFTVTSSTPGFLNMTLSNASGTEVIRLFEMEEIHTNDNQLVFSAVDESGTPLPAGSYTVSGELLDQFGASAGSVSSTFSIASPLSQQTDATDDDTEDDTDDSSSAAKPSGKKPSGQSSSGGTSSSGKPSSHATPSSASRVEYAESSEITIGEEGYEIGVGVSDTVPQEDAGYWNLDASASDAEIWAALTRKMTAVDVKEDESVYIYNSPLKGRESIGSVSGLSQGVNVILKRDDGWSLVEAYRNEDGAFIRGYISSKKLRTVDPNTSYGIVVDKASQTLTVYKDGERVGSCAVSTGKPTSQSLSRETPAGEFITVTRHGVTPYASTGFCNYSIRINGNYRLAEIPATKKKGSDFSILKDKLGEKATRGNICIAHEASSDGGINAKWIWDMTDKNKKVKVLIFDDKDRSEVPVETK